MGTTVFNPSLAPRRKIKKSFLPFRPMLPSASARFTTRGMSVSVASAMPRLILKLRSMKDRRERMLKSRILLFLEALEGHQHSDHAAHPLIVGGGGHTAH